jgi:hypothetical protein
VKKSQLGPPEIEQIIAENLTRGQIRKVFGVGEHAAQLARTQAVAIAGERQRNAGSTVRVHLADLADVDVLRKEAEVYLAHRQELDTAGRLGTDRSKIMLFLGWLAERDA